jgi:hypothetical protein
MMRPMRQVCLQIDLDYAISKSAKHIKPSVRARQGRGGFKLIRWLQYNLAKLCVL